MFYFWLWYYSIIFVILLILPIPAISIQNRRRYLPVIQDFVLQPSFHYSDYDQMIHTYLPRTRVSKQTSNLKRLYDLISMRSSKNDKMEDQEVSSRHPRHNIDALNINSLLSLDTEELRTLHEMEDDNGMKIPKVFTLEQNVLVPFKLKVKKPYIVKVTKHVPVIQPVPYPMITYVPVPKYIPVRILKRQNHQKEQSETVRVDHLHQQTACRSEPAHNHHHQEQPIEKSDIVPEHQATASKELSEPKVSFIFHYHKTKPQVQEYPLRQVRYYKQNFEKTDQDNQTNHLTYEDLQQLMNLPPKVYS